MQAALKLSVANAKKEKQKEKQEQQLGVFKPRLPRKSHAVSVPPVMVTQEVVHAGDTTSPFDDKHKKQQAVNPPSSSNAVASNANNSGNAGNAVNALPTSGQPAQSKQDT